LNLSKNALTVLEARYLKRDNVGNIIESPEELFRRVAKSISEAEIVLGESASAAECEKDFFQALSNLEFLPNSPTLMNAGTPGGQLSACFVVPVEDTIEDIFEAVKNMALIQRTGGGTGFSFSKLRPKGSLLSRSGGRSSGPVSFMKIFDSATENIKQGGKRRGANMGVLRVDHPDILEFITAKLKEGTLRNFNLSVGITDAFMEAVKKDDTFNIICPATNKITGELSAQEIFNKIAECAWRCGDPGVIFLDTINKTHPLRELGEIESTNPCGELPLLPYESCNLASINLARMIHKEGGEALLNWEKLRVQVHEVVRFLDDVIEVNKFPIPEIEKITKKNRKIGLGVMGFAEMLIELGVSYNSEQAVSIAEQLMSFIHREAAAASMILAEKRGVFPNWEKSSHARKNKKIRNATLTSIAPTGTISIIAGTTSGIEPLFALAYRRTNILEGKTVIEINPLFLNYIKSNNLSSRNLAQKLLEEGSLKDLKELPEEAKRLFVTALDIPYQQHLKIQAAFQKYVDNSVSKTINMPESATIEDVKKAYTMAYKLGCKGITVFRYGSKEKQVLELGLNEKVFEKEYFTKCDPEACKM